MGKQVRWRWEPWGALGKGSVGGAGGVSSGVQVGGGGTHGEGLGSKTGRWSWD